MNAFRKYLLEQLYIYPKETLQQQILREELYYLDKHLEHLYEDRKEQKISDTDTAIYRQKDSAWIVYKNGKQEVVGKGEHWKAPKLNLQQNRVKKGSDGKIDLKRLGKGTALGVAMDVG